MKLDLRLYALRFRAHTLGDIRAAMALFLREVARAASRGKSQAEAVKAARASAARGVASSGIGAAAFLLFCAIDARYIEPRWPTVSLAWFALWLAAAAVFAWRYYAVIGQMGWRRAWYRFTGDPRIEDYPVDRAIAPLGRMLARWKIIVRLAGLAGAALLLGGMAAIRFAPMNWASPVYLAAVVVAALAVYWPSIYLNAINQAYHQMMAAKLFSRD